MIRACSTEDRARKFWINTQFTLGLEANFSMKNGTGTLQMCSASLFRINNLMSCRVSGLLMSLFRVERLGEMSTCLCTLLGHYPPGASRKLGCQWQIGIWKQLRLHKLGSWLSVRKWEVKAQSDLALSLTVLQPTGAGNEETPLLVINHWLL